MLQKSRSRFLGPLALGVAALFILLTVATPLATADHVYSHRYIVFGRVVDAEGQPVVGEPISVDYDLVPVENLCNPGQPNDETEAWGEIETSRQTGQFGEFTFCGHVHSMPKSSEGEFYITVGNTTATVQADGLLRRNFVTIQLDETRELDPQTRDAWMNNYTVSGRVWKDTGKTPIEGIGVYGETLNLVDVDVSFVPADGGDPITTTTQTNGYGDFAVRLPVSEEITDGKVEITVNGETFTYGADMETRGSDHEITFEESKALLIAGILGGVAALALLAVWIGGGFNKLKPATGGRKR